MRGYIYPWLCQICNASGGGNTCHCPTCHMSFNSPGMFDKHRTGSHFHDTRRCRTPEEMMAAGYVLGQYHRWVSGDTKPEFWKNKSAQGGAEKKEEQE